MVAHVNMGDGQRAVMLRGRGARPERSSGSSTMSGIACVAAPRICPPALSPKCEFFCASPEARIRSALFLSARDLNPIARVIHHQSGS